MEDIVYKAGLKRFNPKTEKNEFVPFEQILRPNPEAVKPAKAFVATTNGFIKHSTLITANFTDEMIADLIERGHLHIAQRKTI